MVWGVVGVGVEHACVLFELWRGRVHAGESVSVGFPVVGGWDESSGDVYVADPGSDWVEKFDGSGNLVWIAGDGVDQTTGGNLCTVGTGDTCQAGTSGSGPGQFEMPQFVAVDNSGGVSAGDVYVGDSGDNLVTKLTSAGAVVSSWGRFPVGEWAAVGVGRDERPVWDVGGGRGRFDRGFVGV